MNSSTYDCSVVCQIVTSEEIPHLLGWIMQSLKPNEVWIFGLSLTGNLAGLDVRVDYVELSCQNFHTFWSVSNGVNFQPPLLGFLGFWKLQCKPNLPKTPDTTSTRSSIHITSTPSAFTLAMMFWMILHFHCRVLGIMVELIQSDASVPVSLSADGVKRFLVVTTLARRSRSMV